MKEQIRELRVQIDGLAQLTKELKTKKTQVDLALKTKQETIDDFLNRVESEKLGVEIIEQSEQIKKCYDSLLLAKAWLGKVLGELGEETPYTNDGKRKTVEDIEPTNAKNNELSINNFKQVVNWESANHIEKVDWLRQDIKHIIHLVELRIFTSNQSREFAIARTNTYNHLCEARFWLGFELEHIRESSNSNI